MNEKSNPMPMMYKTIPAVAELNKVPGFDPLKFLRHMGNWTGRSWLLKRCDGSYRLN